MRIYKITDINETEVYIGSTGQTLAQRMTVHRSSYRYWKNGGKVGRCASFYLFDKYGLENCRIILLEDVQTDSKEALRAVEHRYITQMTCVNKNSAIPCTGERLKQYKRNYRETHKEKLATYDREYREKHQEQFNTYQQQYRAQHRAKISARAKTKVPCECGAEVAYSALSRHRQTPKHQRLVANIALANNNL